jgi:transcriptional regulator with XRE-family HTH domain
MNIDKKSLPPIAINIRIIRNKKGISQDMLSKLANISFNTVTKIEAGNTPNPTIETVKKIAGALDVSIDSLMK